ncbi:hypothetical protein ABG808_12840 [Streptococcus iniae]
MIAEIITKPMVLGQTRLDFYLSYAAIAYLLALFSALLPVYVIVRRELSHVPAQLLLPKPPVKEAKVLLEKSHFYGKDYLLPIKLLFEIFFVTNKEC